MRKILLLLLGLTAVMGARALTVPVGYSNGQLAKTSSSYSLMGKGNVSAAVYVKPELLKHYAGNKVVGIRVGLYSARYCDSLRVWVRKQLDGENLATAIITRASGGQAVGGWNELTLETPYDYSDGEGFYIGYSYGQKYRDAPFSIVGQPMEATSFVKLGTNGEWQDISADGVLSLECLIAGDNMPACDLKVLSAEGLLYAADLFRVETKIANYGSADATEFDLTFTADGFERTVTCQQTIASGETAVVETALEGLPEGMGVLRPLTVSVTRIAGGEDVNTADNSMVVTGKVANSVLVEEYTGTGCGWCPRGLVGMSKMRETFGDRFVGVGLHQYNNTDPMYISDYQSLAFQGAPQCTVNREVYTDPYVGESDDICDLIREFLARGTAVSLGVEGTYNDNLTQVEATVKLQAYDDFSGLRLSLVLIADGMQGTTNDWRQANNYASNYNASQLPDDLAQFGKGGENGQSYFFWPFDDVALSSYKENNRYYKTLDDFKAMETRDVTLTLNMTTKQALLNVIDYNKVAVVAFVMDKNGKVLNAAKYYLDGGEAGIHDMWSVGDGNAREAARYASDGRRMMTPQSGLNIVKMTDGTTRKVFVR